MYLSSTALIVGEVLTRKHLLKTIMNLPEMTQTHIITRFKKAKCRQQFKLNLTVMKVVHV